MRTIFVVVTPAIISVIHIHVTWWPVQPTPTGCWKLIWECMATKHVMQKIKDIPCMWGSNILLVKCCAYMFCSRNDLILQSLQAVLTCQATPYKSVQQALPCSLHITQYVLWARLTSPKCCVGFSQTQNSVRCWFMENVEVTADTLCSKSYPLCPVLFCLSVSSLQFLSIQCWYQRNIDPVCLALTFTSWSLGTKPTLYTAFYCTT